MRFFFDTSALVKFFYVESGTRIVTQIMEYEDSEIWASDLARLEFTSALYRRYRNKTLDEIKLHIATTYFDKQLVSFNIEPLNQLVIDEAGLFLKKCGKEYGLRALDALHLGTSGEPFTAENLAVKRPGNGVSPMGYWNSIGTTAQCDFEKDELIALGKTEAKPQVSR